MLPKGEYDVPNQTKMFFCCRTDGDPDVPVELPRGRSFAFLKYGDRCQVINRVVGNSVVLYRIVVQCINVVKSCLILVDVSSIPHYSPLFEVSKL